MRIVIAAAPGRFPDPFGMSVITSRFSGVKYFCATRCTSAAVMFWKIVELAVRGRDVVVDDGGVRELLAPCPGSTRG